MGKLGCEYGRVAAGPGLSHLALQDTYEHARVYGRVAAGPGLSHLALQDTYKHARVYASCHRFNVLETFTIGDSRLMMAFPFTHGRAAAAAGL